MAAFLSTIFIFTSESGMHFHGAKISGAWAAGTGSRPLTGNALAGLLLLDQMPRSVQTSRPRLLTGPVRLGADSLTGRRARYGRFGKAHDGETGFHSRRICHPGRWRTLFRRKEIAAAARSSARARPRSHGRSRSLFLARRGRARMAAAMAARLALRGTPVRYSRYRIVAAIRFRRGIDPRKVSSFRQIPSWRNGML